MKKITATETRINGSIRNYVYFTIKKQIIDLELEPGTKISEKEISEKLNVSRTPVREAFLQLANENLIGVFPQSGTIITKIDLSLVEEGRFLRENMERAVVRIACEKFEDEHLFKLETNVGMQELCLKKKSHHRLFEFDDEYHQILFEGTNKVRTWNVIRQMNSHFDRLRMLRLISDLDWSILVKQHKNILNLIISKEADQAEHEMRKHLNLVNIEKEKLIEKHPNFFNGYS